MNQFGGGGLVNTQPDVYLPRTDGPNYRHKTVSELIDEDGDNLTVDVSTRSITTIDYPHHEIHAGAHYFITGFQTADLGDDVTVGVTMPDTDKELHLTTLITGVSEIEISIYEDSVFSAGTTITAINNNRNSTNTSDAIIVGAPTVTTLGTLISTQSSGKAGVNPSKSSGGVNQRENELILRRNTKYIFQTISRDDANIVSWRADWYEHTPKG